MVPSSSPEEEFTTYHQDSLRSFTCPLSNELMIDPVALLCGHTFERKAIQDHFQLGQPTTCPICQHQLPSLDLTPNLSLLGSIQEWKQRDIDIKFQTALSNISSTDPDILTESLETLQSLIDIPHYRDVVSEKELIPVLVELLGCNNTNTAATTAAAAALKCLYHLSCNCDKNKETMIEAGVLPYIMKFFYKEEADICAIALLQELSTKETLREQIGKAKDCIPLLVSMLHNTNHDVTQKAKETLQNLSSIAHFVIKMAEVGYFKPFLSYFIEGTLEIRASMAAALINIQIGDNNTKSFKDKPFMCSLVEMLSSSSPAYLLAGLRCMKKLLLYPKMVKRFLAYTPAISNLIGLISFDSAETHCKLEAIQVLLIFIENLQLSDFQEQSELQELQSQQNVTLFTSFLTTPDTQLRVEFLQLLIVLTQKSEITRNLVRSDTDTINSLFKSLNGDQPEVRQVMKLIYSISEKHPAGVPLPPAPAKEYAINALVTILKSSPDNHKRSIAAGIISLLPLNDIIVDNILHRCEALKAIQEVLCGIDDEHCQMKSPISPDDSLLENSLAALLRYTQPTKPELQRLVCERQLYPALVRILSQGSSLAKEYAAIALAHLSESTNVFIDERNIISKQSNNSAPLLQLDRLLPKMLWCCTTSTAKDMCSIHGSSCSSRNTFCLVKADAVRPLIQIVRDTECGAAKAALTALNTMLKDNRTLSQAVDEIVKNQGVAAILEVLQKEGLPAKEEALDLLHKILEHKEIQNTQRQQAERILIHLLTEDALKKKTALVLRQMKILPDQSSYF